MSYGGVDKYYNPANKVVNDGDTAFAADVNNVNFAVDAAFALVANDLDAFSATVEDVVDRAEAWADTPQGTIPDVLTPGQYSSKAYAIESKEYAVQTEGVPIHKADGTTQVINSALVSATKAAASQADALASKNAAALSESNAYTYSIDAYNEQVAATAAASSASSSAVAADASADLAALSAANLPNATTGGPNVALTTNAAGDAFDYTPITSLGKSLVAASTLAAHKTLLGLENVDNTSDVNKPVSTAQAAAIAAAVPVGVIVPFVGGYFGGSTNGGFVNVLGNTIAAVNALMNPKGWYVCNGSAPNVVGSPVFNTASRYLPNLTDSRFIMGSTGAGTPGGTNDITHSHTMNNHTHTMAHTHDVAPAGVTSGGPSPGNTGNSAVTNVGTTPLSIDQLAAHTHPSGMVYNSGSNYSGFSDIAWPVSRQQYHSTGSTGSSYGHTHSQTVHAHSMDHAHSVYVGNTTSGPASNGTTSQATGNTGSTSLSNLPQYLSAIYIMKVV